MNPRLAMTATAEVADDENRFTDWKPFHPGTSGILGDHDARKILDAFSREAPPAGRGGPHIVTIHLFRDQTEIAPVIARGKMLFDTTIEAARKAIVASHEHVDYTAAAEKIIAATVQVERLQPRVEAAQRARDELLTTNDDSNYASLDAEAGSLRTRLERLDAERHKLQAELPLLVQKLTNRANEICQRLAIARQEELTTRLNTLCGLLEGERNALDDLVELDHARSLLRSLGGQQAARQIVEEITQQHRVHAESVAPASALVPAWCGIKEPSPLRQIFFTGVVGEEVATP